MSGLPSRPDDEGQGIAKDPWLANRSRHIMIRPFTILARTLHQLENIESKESCCCTAPGMASIRKTSGIDRPSGYAEPDIYTPATCYRPRIRAFLPMANIQ